MHWFAFVYDLAIGGALGVSVSKWITWRRRAVEMRSHAQDSLELAKTLLEALQRDGRVTINQVERTPSRN